MSRTGRVPFNDPELSLVVCVGTVGSVLNADRLGTQGKAAHFRLVYVRMVPNFVIRMRLFALLFVFADGSELTQQRGVVPLPACT